MPSSLLQSFGQMSTVTNWILTIVPLSVQL